MNIQSLLVDLRKQVPFRVYAKGPVIELLRELGLHVDKKTPLQVIGVFRSNESGEIVCTVTANGKEKVTASLSHLKLDITHPLSRKVRDYRNNLIGESSHPGQDVNRASFRVGDLYRKK